MESSTQPTGSVLSYAGRLAGQLMIVSGGVLPAAYLHGSAALGGWVPGRSDVDMLFVAADDISEAAANRPAAADAASFVMATAAALRPAAAGA